MKCEGNTELRIKKLVRERYKRYALHSAKELLKVQFNQVEKKVFEKFEKGKKVLDICCAAGRVTIPLSKSGLKVVGIDLVPELIRKAKKNAEIHNARCSFLVADATKLPFKDRAFDYVICCGASLDTLPSPLQIRKAIIEMARALKIGGGFFAQTNNILYPGKYGLAWIGHAVRFLVRLPRRLWRTLKGQDCAGLYFGDVLKVERNQKVKFFCHIPSKDELEKAMDATRLKYEILTDGEFLREKSFKAIFSQTLCIIGYKRST